MPDLETRVPARRFPFLAVLPRVVFAAALAWELFSRVRRGYHAERAWLYVGSRGIRDAIFAVFHLALPALLVASAVLAVVAAVRAARAFRRLPRAGVVVTRVGREGVYVDGALVAARDAIVDATLATYADGAFAVVVRLREGTELVLQVETEARGRELLASLDRADDSLTFSGVTGPRGKDASRLAGAVVAVAILAVFAVLPISSDLQWTFPLRSGPHEFFGLLGEILRSFGFVATGAAVAGLLRPIARLFSSAARVERDGVRFGDAELSRAARFVPFHAVERVVAGDENDVTLTLRDGRDVRLRFSDERPLSERELFIARVREGIDGAGVNSGVRVAPMARVSVDAEEPEEGAEEAAEARRVRRA